MRSINASLLAAALAAGVLAGPAVGGERRIVHGRSIGPIAIGDERAAIAARVGDGVVIARRPSARAPRNRNLDAVTVAYPRLALVVRFTTDEASAGASLISTRAVRYRTIGGLGVGTTRAMVLAAYPRAACGPTLCRVGPAVGDRRITRFSIAALVQRVDVLREPAASAA